MNPRRNAHSFAFDKPTRGSLVDGIKENKTLRGQFSLHEADVKIIEGSAPESEHSLNNLLEKKKNILLKLVAKLTLQRLDGVIHLLEQGNANIEITYQDIQLIEKFLSDHFTIIESSLASYTANPHALVNLILVEIAKAIGPMTGRKTPWLKLLIPPLRDDVAAKYSAPKIDYSEPDFSFKNVVLSKGNQLIIPVNLLVKDEPAFKLLTEEEKRRLFNQSPKAEKLHRARNQSSEFRLSSSGGSGSQLNESVLSQSAPKTIEGVAIKRSSSTSDDEQRVSDEDDKIIDLYLSMMDKTASPNIPVDEASLDLLQNNLRPSMHEIFSGKKDLCQFMVTHLPDRKDWETLLDILGVPVLEKLFSQPLSASEIKADDYHLAMCFCANTLYQRKREKEEELTGRAVGLRLLWGVDPCKTKTAKLKGVNLINGLILQGNEFASVYEELMKSDSVLYKSLTTDDLGKINLPYIDFAKEQAKLNEAALNFGN